MEKVLLTQESYEKLAEELNVLKTKKRREAADALEKARAHGDLRENAEYDAAKEAKKHLETQIGKLELKLSNAQIVDPNDLPKDKVFLGAKLEVKNLDSGDILNYTLVIPDEADFDTGKLSVTSPVGKGLLGKKPNDIAEIDVPAGKLRLQITKLNHE